MRYFIFLGTFLLIASCWEGNTTKTPTIAPKKEASSSTKKNIATIENSSAKWLCIPGKQVGLITNTSTEEDIINAYGKEKVLRRTIGLGEGETTEGTLVFPDTDNEIIIEWAIGKTYQKPSRIRIEKNNTSWKTDQNISIGTSLEELRAINGKDFKFAGFEWDYSGITNDWQGGNIDKHLTVFLEATKPEAIFPDLLGDTLFLSSDPKAKAAGLKVRSMIVELD